MKLYYPLLPKTQALHISQEVLGDDSTEFRIRLLLVPNYELTSTILSYGKEVKVISSQTLKEKIAEQLLHCHTYYNLNTEYIYIRSAGHY